MNICAATLSRATLVYLAFPAVVFVAGWLRPVAGMVVIAVLLGGVARVLRGFEDDAGDAVRVGRGRIAIGLLPVIAALLVSGAGGVGPQTWDWLKHDALFHDLVSLAWPIIYDVEGEQVAMVYGLGWYLPAALFGKVGGWDIGYFALFAWTAIGLLLVYAWLIVLTGGAAITASLVFVFFSGWDAMAAVIHHADRLPALLATYDLEFAWLTAWAYPSHLSMLVHAPQHSLGAWLGGCLLLNAQGRVDTIGPVMLVLGLSTLWSPFSTIALLPFACLLAYREFARRRPGRRSASGALAGLTIGTVALGFYLARWIPYELPDRYYPPPENRDWGDFFLYPLERPPGDYLLPWLEFIGIELAAVCLFVIACYRRGARRDPRAAWVVVAMAWLAALPVAHYGLFNDLSMRGSVVALLVIALAAAVMLRDRAAGPVRRMLLAIALLIGAANPLNMMRLDIGTMIERQSVWFPRAYESVPGLFPFQLEASRYWNLTDQYLGSTDTFFFRWLAAPSQPFVVE